MTWCLSFWDPVISRVQSTVVSPHKEQISFSLPKKESAMQIPGVFNKLVYFQGLENEFV